MLKSNFYEIHYSIVYIQNNRTMIIYLLTLYIRRLFFAKID